MKRSLIYLLFLVVAAGYLGTLIARDPGYVLVTYGDIALQTSLWVMLGLIAALLALVYGLLRLLGVLRRSPLIFEDWQHRRHDRRASDLTAKGMAFLHEGEAARALKFLEAGLQHARSPGLNHLAAARAANDMGDHAARERHLRLAEEVDSSLARARIVVAAELAIERGDGAAALTMLKSIKDNEHIHALRERALVMSEDWREVLKELPNIRSRDKERAEELEREMVTLGLQAEKGNDESVNHLFKGLSGSARQAPDVVAAYVRALSDRDQAEPLLRSLLKKNWQGELVRLYGDLGHDSLNMRRKTAEGWQRKHREDPDLQFCLGCIYEASGAPGLARESFAKSIDLKDTPEARERLGLLLLKEGQVERGREYLESLKKD